MRRLLQVDSNFIKSAWNNYYETSTENPLKRELIHFKTAAPEQESWCEIPVNLKHAKM